MSFMKGPFMGIKNNKIPRSQFLQHAIHMNCRKSNRVGKLALRYRKLKPVCDSKSYCLKSDQQLAE
jgi:hypothetical protein